MKPRTKQQCLVYGLSVELPNLKDRLRPWAFDKCIDHIGYRTKSATSCLSCGHVFNGHPTAKTDKCPCCERKLIVKNSRKKKLRQTRVFAVIDVKGGFQVTRFFEIDTHHRSGSPAQVSIWEVVQHWLLPDGKYEIIARNRGGMGMYLDTFHGDLEIKKQDTIWKYNLVADKIYPKATVLPVYKRNGFTTQLGKVSPYDLFTRILNDSVAETLLKAKQVGLLAARFSDRYSSVSRFWNSVKICMRNRYIIKDSITWLDYLELLQYFGRDLHSAKYVCPRNLKKEHDRLVAKKAAREKRLKLERMQRQIEEDQIMYADSKGIYFGLQFSEGDLTVKVLEHVREFFEEGEIHKHCVFTNRYHQKANSLLFSAKIDGRPIETIEVSLSDFKITQSRGLQNRPTEYHDKIVELVSKNMRMIRKRHKGLKMEAA